MKGYIKTEWTPDQISELFGKVVLITGGNCGLGFETAKLFVKKGARVVITTRDQAKGEEAVKKIIDYYALAEIQYMVMDLNSQQSIRSFANDFLGKFKTLDILFNNAGVMITPYGLTEDGLEQHQGINYFGHFLLTSLLFKNLKNTKNSRIVNISSMAHLSGKMNFNNLFYENKKGYSRTRAYSRSKLENLIFTFELDRRIQKANLNIKVFAAHPGAAKTNLLRYTEESFIYKLFSPVLNIIFQDATIGCLPGIRAATDLNAISGEFYGPNSFFGMKGSPIIIQASKESYNHVNGQKLWEISEKVTNTTFEV